MNTIHQSSDLSVLLFVDLVSLWIIHCAALANYSDSAQCRNHPLKWGTICDAGDSKQHQSYEVGGTINPSTIILV